MTDATDGGDAWLATNRRTFLTGSVGTVLGTLAGCSTPDGGATSPRTETDTATQDDPTETSTAAATPDPEFEHPDSVSFDEPFTLAVSGLPAGTVDVSMTLEDYTGNEWTARATYETADGRLSLANTTPNDEDFGAGAMALLQQATFDLGDTAFYPGVERPNTVTIGVHRAGETLGTSEVERTFGGVGRSAREITDEEFVGTVYEPPGTERAPGVVVLHGSEGTPAGATAAMLATHGFRAVALHYFEWRDRHEQLPNELVEVPVEFVERAAEWLLDGETTVGSQVGALGFSKGGELALLAGSSLDTVGPVVSVSGSGYVWEGVARTSGEARSSWTSDGEPVPFVPYVRDDETGDTATPAEFEPVHTASLENAGEERLAEARIPVERIDAPVLLVTGGRDRLWNTATLHAVAADHLEPSQVDHRRYEDAGHLIRFPYRPVTNRREGQRYVFGGTPAGYAEADTDHWPRVIDLFSSLKSE